MTKLIIIGCIIIAVFLLLRLFVCKFFYRCLLLNDILKDKQPDGSMKYSQGRVYLLLSIISYYIMIGMLTSKALKPAVGFDNHSLQMIVDALQWAIALFAGYVFGTKGLEALKLIMKKVPGGDLTQEQPKAPVEQMPPLDK